VGTIVRVRFETVHTNLLNHRNFLQQQSLDISSASTFGVTQTVQSAEDGGNRGEQLSLRLDLRWGWEISTRGKEH
jgi:hypothetical protein